MKPDETDETKEKLLPIEALFGSAFLAILMVALIVVVMYFFAWAG